MRDEDNDPYRLLGEAIVDQAISDYIKCHKHIKVLNVKRKKLETNKKKARRPSTIESINKQLEKINTKLDAEYYEIYSIENFIESEWFTELTPRSPDRLLKMLKEEVAKYDSKRIPKSAI